MRSAGRTASTPEPLSTLSYATQNFDARRTYSWRNARLGGSDSGDRAARIIRQGETMKAKLRHDHQTLLNSLLGGKLPRNLSWSDAVDLIEQIGQVQARGGDEFTFVVGEHRALFNHPHSHQLDVEEVSRLRTFLHGAGVANEGGDSKLSGAVAVLIDHHAAHIYSELGGAIPAGEVTVEPRDPFRYHHHLVHRKEAHYAGEHVPEEAEFYDEIAKGLAPAEKIVLIGHGVGKSNAAQFLAHYLKKHHPAVAEHIVAIDKADLSAVTEAEIEAIARRSLMAAPEAEASLQTA